MKKIVIPALIALFGLAGYGIAAKTADAKKAEITPAAQEVINNIMARKSVRSFTGKTVEQQKTDMLVKAAMAAPSGRDKRPWEIIVVNDKEILNKLAKELPSGRIIGGAPMAIIIAGDVSISSDLWIMDCSAAAQNLLLTAQALGLGAVWTAAYPSDKNVKAVQKALSLPENVIPLTVIPVGYPKGDTKAKDKFDKKKIHYNKW